MSDWFFSSSLHRRVRAIERVELWGQQQARAWDPAQDRVLLLPTSTLPMQQACTPLCCDAGFGGGRMLRVTPLVGSDAWNVKKKG